MHPWVALISEGLSSGCEIDALTVSHLHPYPKDFPTNLAELDLKFYADADATVKLRTEERTHTI